MWQGTARNLVPYLSVRENVRLPGVLHCGTRVGSPAERRRAAALVDLADRANHKVGQLSGGEQQRAAIAVALSNTPMLLLADEPTAELDSVSADRVLESFRAVNREFGVTIVMVTHDLTAARRADRRIRVRDGRILHEGLAGRAGRERRPRAAARTRPSRRSATPSSRPRSPPTRSACGGGARPAMPEPILEAQAHRAHVRRRQRRARRPRRIARPQAEGLRRVDGPVRVRQDHVHRRDVGPGSSRCGRGPLEGSADGLVVARAAA